MRVFLVGFMGAGKTTTGRALALRLPALFWDLDARVEAAFGMTVAEIFRNDGEPVFRAEEGRQLRALAGYPSAVVATGGGTFTFPDHREVIRAAGVSVFLDAPWEDIARRLPGKRDERPLFGTLEQGFDLYSRRLPHYRMADIVVQPGPGESPESLARRIAALVRPRQ